LVSAFDAKAKAGSEMVEESPEPERYYLKAMNCPHHHRIFAAEPSSYRDLPLRLAEYGTCYRYEQSGELFGLMRGRMLNMNDAHIYCQPEKFAEEFNAVNEMYLKYFKIFGLEKYVMRFSTHDPARLGEKFVMNRAMDRPSMVRDVPEQAASTMSKCERSGVLRPEDRRAGVGDRPRIHRPNQVDFAVPAGSASFIATRTTSTRPRSASSRASARTVHRISYRALRRQFPALARARPGALSRGDDERSSARPRLV
jgi:threonyl-tRNA synthetase